MGEATLESNRRLTLVTLVTAVLTLLGTIAAAAIAYRANDNAIKAQSTEANIQFTKGQQATAYTRFIESTLTLENAIYDYAILFAQNGSSTVIDGARSPVLAAKLRSAHEQFTVSYFNCVLFTPREADQQVDALSDSLELAYRDVIGAGENSLFNRMTQAQEDTVNATYNNGRTFNEKLRKLRLDVVGAAKNQFQSSSASEPAPASPASTSR